ncbi:hypothetical protein LF1_22900 [Rubripirellula obstinata]|uniref:Uncharacterized protein n=1 Tax=Rubripirellula obstinata TaxID=406547 RepID=A0A5B1CK29_9BACT|nr:hypothetical protein LF1_22900 [Rubripirellula obstinata]
MDRTSDRRIDGTPATGRVGFVSSASELTTFHSRLSLRESSEFATFAERKATLIARSLLSQFSFVQRTHFVQIDIHGRHLWIHVF